MRRRFVKRVYIPLPSPPARSILVKHLMETLEDNLSEEDFATIVTLTDGFSGSDLKQLCADAAMGPVRQLGSRIKDVRPEDVSAATTLPSYCCCFVSK